MPDFGLLQMPNFAQAALGGYQAGQAIGKQRQLDSALQGFDFKRPETAMAVLRADPALGASLLNASGKMAEMDREATARSLKSSFLLDYVKRRDAKGGGQAISVPGPGVTGPVPSSAMPSGQEGDIVVSAAREGPTPEAQLIQADPEAWLNIRENLDKLDKGHREAIAAAADAQGSVAMSASSLPYQQRKAYIQAQAPFLLSHGVTQDQIDAFDPTDAALAAQRDQALGVQGILNRQNQEADNARADKAQASADKSRALRDGLAIRSDRRAAAARGEAHVRFTERDKDRAALAASGGGGLPTNTDDLDY